MILFLGNLKESDYIMIMLRVRETGAKKNGARLGERKINAGPVSAVTKCSTFNANSVSPVQPLLHYQRSASWTYKNSSVTQKRRRQAPNFRKIGGSNEA